MVGSPKSSTHEPPASDRDLNVDIVRLVMQEQFPRLELETIEHLGSGWEYDAYLIDRHLVVRFPRYADVASDLDSAETILDFVFSAVGSAVGVPKIILKGEGSTHFPHRFFGHELIPGVDANDPRAPKSLGLASDLGQALTHIHSISPSSASEIGIGPQKWNCRTAFDALVRLVDVAPGMRALAPEPYAWLQGPPTVPAEYSGPLRFIHDDFQPEHIIVSLTAGRLTGVIDWGAALGDPAQDLTFLLPWRGWSFTRAILDAYELPLDEEFVERLDFLGRVRALGWLAHAVVHGGDTEESLLMCHNVFASGGSSSYQI